MEVEEEDPPFATFSDDLPKIPHVERILQDHLAETAGRYAAALQQREMHGIVRLFRHRQHDFQPVLKIFNYYLIYPIYKTCFINRQVSKLNK